MKSGILAVIATGCGLLGDPHTPKSDEYSAQIEACLQSATTCEEYVECQHAAQLDAGYPITGTCENQ